MSCSQRAETSRKPKDHLPASIRLITPRAEIPRERSQPGSSAHMPVEHTAGERRWRTVVAGNDGESWWASPHSMPAECERGDIFTAQEGERRFCVMEGRAERCSPVLASLTQIDYQGEVCCAPAERQPSLVSLSSGSQASTTYTMAVMMAVRMIQASWYQ